jgi:hypothetical protein
MLLHIALVKRSCSNNLEKEYYRSYFKKRKSEEKKHPIR